MTQIQAKVGEKPRPVPKTTVIFRKRVCCKTCHDRGCVGRCRY